MLNENKIEILSISPTQISWPTIIMGAIVIITLSILLNLFNAALGFSIVLARNGVLSLVLGSAIWLVLSGILAMLLAGFLIGISLPGTIMTNATAKIVHGFLSWGLALIVTFFLSISAGGQLFVGSSLYLTQDAMPPGLLSHKVDVMDREADQLLAETAQNQKSDLALKAQQQLRHYTHDEKVAAAAAGASLLAFLIMFTGLLATLVGTHLGSKKVKTVVI